MPIPTLSQIVAALEELRASTPANPIQHNEMIDVLVGIANNIPSSGSDPSKASLAGAAFTGQVTVSEKVGIGKTTPTVPLDVLGNTVLTGQVTVSEKVGIGKTTPTVPLDVLGNTVLTGTQKVTGVVHLGSRVHVNTGANYTDQAIPLYVEGQVKINGLLSIKRLAGVSAAPAIALGTGAGTGATVSIVGDDIAGRITITTGTTPTANGTLATITFAEGAYDIPPYPLLNPGNAAASSQTLAARPFVDAAATTTTTATIKSGATAMAASTVFIFLYHIIA